MQQADMPGGVANLLHLTTNNLQIEDINGPSSEKENKEEEGNGKQ